MTIMKDIFGSNNIEFKRIKLSDKSTNKLKFFKGKTGLTPNIVCRLALSLSLMERNVPSIELYNEDSGQEINRYTLFGEHELIPTSLFTIWCRENRIEEPDQYQYFVAHINRGVELLTNRVKGLEDLLQLIE